MVSDEEYEEILFKIESQIGKPARHVVKVLLDAEDVLSLEQIEQELEEVAMEFESKNIRQVLYELSDRGYARSRRLQNRDTGWISYLWNLFPDKILAS